MHELFVPFLVGTELDSVSLQTGHGFSFSYNTVLRRIEPLKLDDKDLVAIMVEKADAKGANAPSDDKSLFEVFQAAGLIVCVKDAPSDLSTNPKHMEGLGACGE